MMSSEVIHLVCVTSVVFVWSDHLRVTYFSCLMGYYKQADVVRCEQTWQTDWWGMTR